MTKWKDDRDIRVISNACIPEFVESVNRHGKYKQKPNVVHIYNQNMSAIDCSDQMLLYHSWLRKTSRSYKKVEIDIIKIFMANAFYLYEKNSLAPRISGMKELKEKNINILTGAGKPSKHVKPQAASHYLSPIPSTEKKQNPARLCKHCSTKKKKKKRKDTS